MNPMRIWESIARLRPEVLGIWTLRIVASIALTYALVWGLRRLGRVQARLAAFMQRTLQQRGGLIAPGARGLLARSADVLYRAARTVLGMLRIVVSLTLVYVWLASVTILLDPSRRLFAAVLAPLVSSLETVGQAMLEYLPNIVMLVVIVAVARFITRLASALTDAIGEGELEVPWLHADVAEPTRRLVTIGIWLLSLIIAVPYLPGAQSKAFQGIGLIIGVLVSLGSGSAAGNLLAGLVLMYSRVFRPGDRVKIGDTIGDVIALGAFQTRVRTIKDEEVTIPNATVQQSAVVNFSRFAREQGVQVYTSVTIGYETPWRQVHALLIEAAMATDGIEKSPAPYVLQRALGDFYVSYEVCAYCKLANALHLVQGRLNETIQDTFFRDGVEICSPHFTNLRDGSRVQIPAEAAQASGPKAERPRPDSTS